MSDNFNYIAMNELSLSVNIVWFPTNAMDVFQMVKGCLGCTFDV